MNILIENIPSSASEEDLRKLFGAYGVVESVYLVKDKHSGMQNGQAYVRMPSDDEAEQAINGLNGTDFEGQQIRVKQAENADFPSGDFW